MSALVDFFNTPDGYRRFGHRGDYEGWEPEQTAAHYLAEYAALLSQADGGVVGLPPKGTLRLCGYCRSWNSKPCGEQCVLSLNDPTWEQIAAEPTPTPPEPLS